MTAEILRLSGLDNRNATLAADELLADRVRHPVLRRMLVMDDAAALFDRASVYQLLLTSGRMERLLCVAVGPLVPPAPGRGPKLRIPPNISSQQGSAVLWVGDPQGVDVSLMGRLADGHQGTPLSGLDYLLEVLSVDEVFDKVIATLRNSVGDGVASPGLHLAGADDEAVSFAAALVLATRRITAPGTGLAASPEGPYPSLLPAGTGPVHLDPDGELAGYRDGVAAAAAAAGKRRGGLLHRDRSDPRDDVVAVGADLRAMRDRVAQLFTTAQSTGEPTEAQRDQIIRAGVVLPPAPRTAAGSAGHPLTAQSVGQAAVRSGDTLPKVIRRLTLTAKQLKHEGSASHLRDVEQACPQPLVGRLLGTPPRPEGKAAADTWLQGLGLADAVRAAERLDALVLEVARTEWAVGGMTADEVTRTRIVLDGICKRLTEHASNAEPPTLRGAQAGRITRLSESLTPILYDLVDRVLATEAAAPSPGGQQAYDRARAKTGDLLTEWQAHAASKGDIFSPPFAATVLHDSRMYVEDDVAGIRDALQHDARQVMWQLCGPGDLGMLKPSEPLSVVAFAPRQTKEALGAAVPQDMTWTRSGSHAGLLRLVPLRPSAIWVVWVDREDMGEAAADALDDVLSETGTDPWS
jgi:hypothetical protein